MKLATAIPLLLALAAPSAAGADDLARVTIAPAKGDGFAHLSYINLPAMSRDGTQLVLPEPGYRGFSCAGNGNGTHQVRTITLGQRGAGKVTIIKHGCEVEANLSEVNADWRLAAKQVAKLNAVLAAGEFHHLPTTDVQGKARWIRLGDDPVMTNLPASANLTDLDVTISAPSKNGNVTVTVTGRDGRAVSKKIAIEMGFMSAREVFIAPGATRRVFVELWTEQPRSGMMKSTVATTEWVELTLDPPAAAADSAAVQVTAVVANDGESAAVSYHGLPALSASGDTVALPQPGLTGRSCASGGNAVETVLFAPLTKAGGKAKISVVKAGCEGYATDETRADVNKLIKNAPRHAADVNKLLSAGGYHAIATVMATGKVTDIPDEDAPVSTNLPARAGLGELSVEIGAPVDDSYLLVAKQGKLVAQRKLTAGYGFATARRVFKLGDGPTATVFVEIWWEKPRAGMMKDTIAETDWIELHLDPTAAPAKPINP